MISDIEHLLMNCFEEDEHIAQSPAGNHEEFTVCQPLFSYISQKTSSFLSFWHFDDNTSPHREYRSSRLIGQGLPITEQKEALIAIYEDTLSDYLAFYKKTISIRDNYYDIKAKHSGPGIKTLFRALPNAIYKETDRRSELSFIDSVLIHTLSLEDASIDLEEPCDLLTRLKNMTNEIKNSHALIVGASCYSHLKIQAEYESKAEGSQLSLLLADLLFDVSPTHKSEALERLNTYVQQDLSDENIIVDDFVELPVKLPVSLPLNRKTMKAESLKDFTQNIFNFLKILETEVSEEKDTQGQLYLP